jgi:hypothetical protein
MGVLSFSVDRKVEFVRIDPQVVVRSQELAAMLYIANPTQIYRTDLEQGRAARTWASLSETRME